MKSFRDFFYDRNDIFVAAVILLLAGLLIFTKIDAIMDYPHADTDTGKRVKKIENPDHSKKNTSADPSDKKYPYGIYIASGESAENIGSNLVRLGLFSSTEDFINKLNEKGLASKIHAGTFEIPQDATEDEIIRIITSSPNGGNGGM